MRSRAAARSNGDSPSLNPLIVILPLLPPPLRAALSIVLSLPLRRTTLSSTRLFRQQLSPHLARSALCKWYQCVTTIQFLTFARKWSFRNSSLFLSLSLSLSLFRRLGRPFLAAFLLFPFFFFSFSFFFFFVFVFSSSLAVPILPFFSFFFSSIILFPLTVRLVGKLEIHDYFQFEYMGVYEVK